MSKFQIYKLIAFEGFCRPDNLQNMKILMVILKSLSCSLIKPTISMHCFHIARCQGLLFLSSLFLKFIISFILYLSEDFIAKAMFEIKDNHKHLSNNN